MFTQIIQLLRWVIDWFNTSIQCWMYTMTAIRSVITSTQLISVRSLFSRYNISVKTCDRQFRWNPTAFFLSIDTDARRRVFVYGVWFTLLSLFWVLANSHRSLAHKQGIHTRNPSVYSLTLSSSFIRAWSLIIRIAFKEYNSWVIGFWKTDLTGVFRNVAHSWIIFTVIVRSECIHQS